MPESTLGTDEPRHGKRPWRTPRIIVSELASSTERKSTTEPVEGTTPVGATFGPS